MESELDRHLTGFPEGVKLISTLWVNPHSQPIITPLHFDLGNAFHCVFQGKKIFTFAEPALTPELYPYPQYHPGGRQAIPFSVDESLTYEETGSMDGGEWLRHKSEVKNRFMNVTIRAGECLYQPGFWWHKVFSYPGAISANLVAYEDEDDEVLRPWKDVSYSRYHLLFKIENWVTYSFIDAVEVEQALQLVNGFFTSAAAGKPPSDWVPPNGERMIGFIQRRLERMDVEVTNEDLIQMFRDIGHRRYDYLGKKLGLTPDDDPDDPDDPDRPAGISSSRGWGESDL